MALLARPLVAWIGLGRIGAPMAERLIAAGHDLAVFDVVDDAMDALVCLGARAARSPGDAASGAHGRSAFASATVMPSKPPRSGPRGPHQGPPKMHC